VSSRLVELTKRFARLATRAVVARPAAWRLFRGPLRRMFDWLAPAWEGRRGPEDLASLAAALERLDRAPERVLDLGTGTGLAARLLARRFPAAEIVGIDLAPAMVAEAERLLPPELRDRVRFAVGDASALPFSDAEFDLVVLLNMIPFFDELARITAPGGTVVVAWSSGPGTPIYTPPETIKERLTPLGFERYEDLAVGEATGLVARKPGAEPVSPGENRAGARRRGGGESVGRG
jgi:SAM-dependent methyltransferase